MRERLFNLLRHWYTVAGLLVVVSVVAPQTVGMVAYDVQMKFGGGAPEMFATIEGVNAVKTGR